MTERLSDVLVTAITSLGVQKLAYEIGVFVVPQLLAVGLFLLSALLWVDGGRLRALQRLLLRILLFVAVFRFCLPLSSMASAFVHTHFFAERIEIARHELALGLAEIDKLNEMALPEIEGILGTIENSAAFLKRKSVEFKNAILYAVRNMGGIIENLLTLTFLYVGMFLIQVVILPLLSFWLLVKAAGSLFDPAMPGLGQRLPPAGEKAAAPV